MITKILITLFFVTSFGFSPAQASEQVRTDVAPSTYSFGEFHLRGGTCNQWGCSKCGTCTQWGCPDCDSGSRGGTCNQWGCSDAGECNQWGCSDRGTCSQWGCP